MSASLPLKYLEMETERDLHGKAFKGICDQNSNRMRENVRKESDGQNAAVCFDG